MTDFNSQIAFLTTEIDKAETQMVYHKKTAKDYEDSASSMRKQLKEVLLAEGVIKTETERFNVTVKNVPPSVLIPDNEAVPEGFYRIKKDPDKTKIKEFLKASKCNWAQLSEPTTTIQLTVKK